MDPPVGEFIKIGKGAHKVIRSCPNNFYQGGYVDISPFPCVPDVDKGWEPQPGPSRESIFDDILFYWNHTDRFPNLHSHVIKDPAGFVDGTSFFLKSIIAANWMQFLVYFDEIIDRLEYALARADIKTLDGVENHLVDVEFWYRRCWKSCEQVERSKRTIQYSSNLDHGTSLPNSQITALTGSTFTSMEDFVHIYNQMCALKERCHRLSLSLTHVISVIQSRQSSEEANSLKILTLLGMLFVPLTFVSGIFSMSGEFLPGANKFWVYFVTSAPMVIMVFSVVFAKQVAQALRLKPKRRKALLDVKLTARPAKFEREQKDVEKGNFSVKMSTK